MGDDGGSKLALLDARAIAPSASAVAVGPEVDPRDLDSVEGALQTRVQPYSDTIINFYSAITWQLLSHADQHQNNAEQRSQTHGHLPTAKLRFDAAGPLNQRPRPGPLGGGHTTHRCVCETDIAAD